MPALEDKHRSAETVVDLLPDEGDVVVGAANAEPRTLVDAIEVSSSRLPQLRLHQMLPLRDRPSIDGSLQSLRHVSWFLSPHDREAFNRGACDLVPDNFSDVPRLMAALRPALALAAAAPPDAHGCLSRGLHATTSHPSSARFPSS